MRMLLAGLLVVLALGLIGVASADIYVDEDNAGDPSMDGTSDHPYNTIQRGIDNATSGEDIYVWGGSYWENVLVNKTVNLIGWSGGGIRTGERNTRVLRGNGHTIRVGFTKCQRCIGGVLLDTIDPRQGPVGVDGNVVVDDDHVTHLETRARYIDRSRRAVEVSNGYGIEMHPLRRLRPSDDLYYVGIVIAYVCIDINRCK